MHFVFYFWNVYLRIIDQKLGPTFRGTKVVFAANFGTRVTDLTGFRYFNSQNFHHIYTLIPESWNNLVSTKNNNEKNSTIFFILRFVWWITTKNQNHRATECLILFLLKRWRSRNQRFAFINMNNLWHHISCRKYIT